MKKVVYSIILVIGISLISLSFAHVHHSNDLATSKTKLELANSIQKNDITRTDDILFYKVKITITLDWGRKRKNCRGFGICKISITVEKNYSDKSSIYTATNFDGRLGLILSEENLKDIEEYFGGEMIILEEDYILPEELIKALQLKQKIIKKGKYDISFDNNLKKYVVIF